MIETFDLDSGIPLRCFPAHKFTQGCLSIQLIRPMCREEAALNSLLPAVLLRGTRQDPDLRAITLHLDDLYGAGVGALNRQVGDYQVTGLTSTFMEDRYALPGDRVLAPMIEFLGQLLREPLLPEGAFCPDFVEGEKKNLLSAIAARRNNKRSYAGDRMTALMCKNDPSGLPQWGTAEEVSAITPQRLYDHYTHILQTSQVELFYVGSADPAQVAELVRPLFGGIRRAYAPLPAQTVYRPSEPGTYTEALDVAQGRLCMGFTSQATLEKALFVPMQVFNTLFGGGMSNRLFDVLREKMSLCYDIGSGYQGSKGILTVAAGIDFDQYETACREIRHQLRLCQEGRITQQELTGAKLALTSQLRGTHDAPSSIESYYATTRLSGLGMTPDQYMEAVERVTLEEAVQAANTLREHTVYFLRGDA